MGLTVQTPASHQLLCDLPTVKAELGIGTTDQSKDALLLEYIQDASEAIKNYCNRTFAQQTYVETLAGFGSVYMQLHESPIIGTPTVLFQGTAVTDFSVEDPDAGLLYRQALWTWTAQVGWVLTGWVAPRSEAVDATGAFQVTYTAGFILPGQVNPPVLPANGGKLLPRDIVKAARDLTRMFYLRKSLDPELAERRVGGFAGIQLRYQESDKVDLPRSIAWLLKPYQRAML